ncbi:hypothetical protein AZE42_10978 [Rhizopogon vesiculosus]|uniref:Uncharacterized protein n=1 Tax=Rhizopogon vesiculosus TaxID=180088 RepID=A0A1J8QGW8_9AGAM|nr:hypothetical protein AZE42_10978 [Rhizopogon vesiculosus]
MHIVSSTEILLLTPHDSERREDPTVVTVVPNGQLSIKNLDHSEVPGENSFDPKGDRTQLISVLTVSATGVQTISVIENGTISFGSAISTSFKSLSSFTVTIILSNSTSTNSSLSAPTALASSVVVNTDKTHFPTSGNRSPFTPTALPSPVFVNTTTTHFSTSSNSSLSAPTTLASPTNTTRTHLSVVFYVVIILAAVCIIACGLVFLIRRIRSRAAAQNAEDDDQQARDSIEDSSVSSLEAHISHEGPELYLLMSIIRQDGAGRSTPSVQETPRTVGRLRVANIAPGDLTSGDESSILYRTQTHQSIKIGEVGPQSSAVQERRETPSPLGGDRLAQSSPTRTPRVMEDTSGIDPRDCDLPAKAKLHDSTVHEHSPPETWATVFKSNLTTSLGTVIDNHTQYSSASKESTIPLHDQSQPHPEPVLEPDVSLTARAEQPQPRNRDIPTFGEPSHRELGGNHEDLGVSQSNPALRDRKGTDMPVIRTEESHVPLEHDAAPVDIAESPSPDKSRASQTSPGGVYSSESESEAATKANLKNYPYGMTQPHPTFSSNEDALKPHTNAMQPGHSKASSRKRGGERKRSAPRSAQREPSSTTSIISGESDSPQQAQPGHQSMREHGGESAVGKKPEIEIHEPQDD